MKAFLQRIDRFLGLFERYVELQEAEFLRAKLRDEDQRIFFQRQAEAAENIASSSNAQAHTARRSVEALKEATKRLDGGEP